MAGTTDLTLSIQRAIDAPRNLVWRCWTENELLAQWFCPKPWRVSQADMDIRSGGRMNTVMEGPDGERIENVGSFLEVVERQRLIFTDAYSEGFVPRPTPFMTGLVELSDMPNGRTQMVWSARHATEEAMQQHLEMGFEAGWKAAAEQLNNLAKALADETNS